MKIQGTARPYNLPGNMDNPAEYYLRVEATIVTSSDAKRLKRDLPISKEEFEKYMGELGNGGNKLIVVSGNLETEVVDADNHPRLF